MIKICPILSIAKHLSDNMGTNCGTVQCQKEECMFFWKREGVCIISRQSPEILEE